MEKTLINLSLTVTTSGTVEEAELIVEEIQELLNKYADKLSAVRTLEVLSSELESVEVIEEDEDCEVVTVHDMEKLGLNPIK